MSPKMGRPSVIPETYERIRRMLEEEALWGRQLSTERELARTFGVSRMTVRHALDRLEAEGLVERAQGRGTFACEQRGGLPVPPSANILLIAESHHEEEKGWAFYGEVIRGLTCQAERMKAKLTVLSLDRPDEAERLEQSRGLRRFNAFISLGVDDHDLLARLVTSGRGPVVLIDGYVIGLPVITVVDEGFEGMRAVTRHLLGLGHRRIAFIDCFDRAVNNPHKFGGYRSALAQAGINLDEELVASPESAADDVHDEDGPSPLAAFSRAAVRRFMALPEPPTALIGFDDNRALPAIEELGALGLRAGRDVSVAGFGDQAFRQGRSRKLTSCRIYPRKMGQESVRLALANPSAREGRTVFVPTRLQVRSTTCPPPAISRGGLKGRQVLR